MNLTIGSQKFINVKIPILWGKRAILQDQHARLSIIFLSDNECTLEILGNRPAKNIDFSPTEDGYKIRKNGKEAYHFNVNKKILTDLDGSLPECEIKENGIRAGTNHFQSNLIAGFDIGIHITEQGIGIGVKLGNNLPDIKIER